MNAQLICLRHAEAQPTSRVADNGLEIANAPPDPPLTAGGQRQAMRAARKLETKNPRKIFASDALRSLQTGQIIASHLGVSIEVLPALAEAKMGRADYDQTDTGARAEALKQWIVSENLNYRLTGGESGQLVKTRMKRALLAIATEFQGGTAIVVGHAGSLMVGVSALCHNGPSLWNKPLPHAVPFSLNLSGEGWKVDWPTRSE